MHRLRFSSRLIDTTTVCLAALIFIEAQSASALITGGEGNQPVRDPGWPTGAAAVFNHPSRIAYWEGPPFGGGEYHAEYRGDVKELNALLAGFAKIDAKIKRIIVHDGVGHSFWINPNREKAKEAESQIDWTFTVWDPRSWQQLHKLPGRYHRRTAGSDDETPPIEFEIYTGGTIRWANVVVPQGIELADNRLEAHGFTFDDGTVLEGMVTDLDTKKRIAARVELQRVEPQKKGGYNYPVAKKLATDANGHWVLKRTPANWGRIVVAADGYVPRVVGFGQFDEQPGWHEYNAGLTPPTQVTGHVTDNSGKPIQDVAVRLDDVEHHGELYESPDEYKTTTDADGRFHFDQVPAATARVWVSKTGYCHSGLGPTITTPAKDVALTMKAAGVINVTVDFGNAKRPKGYIVELEPEGGNVVGSWGGSGNINKENKISFKDAPPGRYSVKGRPNPGSAKEETTPITIDLKGGENKEVKITAVPPPNRN